MTPMLRARDVAELLRRDESTVREAVSGATDRGRGGFGQAGARAEGGEKMMMSKMEWSVAQALWDTLNGVYLRTRTASVAEALGKQAVVELAARVAAAHDVARWRTPRLEDFESGRVFDVILATRGAEKWHGPIRTKLSGDLSVLMSPATEVMIADPLPLPELPKVTP